MFTALCGPVTLGVIHFFLLHLERQAFSALFTFWAFIFVLFSMLYGQTSRLDESLNLLSNAAAQPLKMILRFNNMLLVVFGAAAASAALLASFIPLDRAVRAIGSFLLSILRFLAGLLPAYEPPPALETAPDPPSPDFGGMIASEAAQTPRWLELLQDILRIALLTAFACAVLCAVLYGIYRLYRRFHENRPGDGDLREYIGPVLEKERLKGALQSLRSLLSFGRGTEALRVRRLYARKVRLQIRRGAPVTSSDTTGEIYDKLPFQNGLAELTGQYNTVRYGPESKHAGHSKREPGQSHSLR